MGERPLISTIFEIAHTLLDSLHNCRQTGQFTTTKICTGLTNVTAFGAAHKTRQISLYYVKRLKIYLNPRDLAENPSIDDG